MLYFYLMYLFLTAPRSWLHQNWVFVLIWCKILPYTEIIVATIVNIVREQVEVPQMPIDPKGNEYWPAKPFDCVTRLDCQSLSGPISTALARCIVVTLDLAWATERYEESTKSARAW